MLRKDVGIGYNYNQVFQGFTEKKSYLCVLKSKYGNPLLYFYFGLCCCNITVFSKAPLI